MSASLPAWAEALLPRDGPEQRRVAYFITAHGFGHASRACAVMAALRSADPQLHFEVFTQAPAWLFQESLGQGFTHHAVQTDVGLVQHDAWREDLAATVQRLGVFLPFDPFLISSWAAWLNRLDCRLVLCDVAPLGLVVAQAAGLPSVLIENFTWDWIYAGYLAAEPGFAPFIDSLRQAYATATYRLQTDPVCELVALAARRLAPISRPPRNAAHRLRAHMSIPADAHLVLLTVGGLAAEVATPDAGALPEDVYVVIAGAVELRREGRYLWLPHDTRLYHPDLVNAADAVVGKLGYSTVAEAYHAGLPIGYVARPRFRESAVMAAFVERHLAAMPIEPAALASGQWIENLPALLSLPRRASPVPNGANEAAAFILPLID